LFVTVTVALGTAAPLASLTWPMIALVVSPWGKVTSGKRKWNIPTRTTIERIERSLVVEPVPFTRTIRMINHTYDQLLRQVNRAKESAGVSCNTPYKSTLSLPAIPYGPIRDYGQMRANRKLTITAR
jgi:hypothetical protein